MALFERDSYSASNISAYVAGTALGESALNAPTNLTNVTQELVPSSTPIPFGTATFAPGGGEGEVELDMNMVQAVAPQANLIVYEGTPGTPATPGTPGTPATPPSTILAESPMTTWRRQSVHPGIGDSARTTNS